MTGPDRRRDIARLALQSALAGALAWLAIGWAGTGEAFLAVISAVLVLEPARAQTLKSAGSRIVGTLVGTVIGLVALLAASGVPDPLPLAAVMLVMGAIVAWKPAWRYGIVAAAGLAIASDGGLIETAEARGIAIFV
ncbi:MAG: FUSC family protein, partial [Allosphingosinicella sp.]